MKKERKILVYKKIEHVSSCCSAEVKMNPIKWASPYHVELWQAWCLKCEKPCKIKKV